MASRKLSMVTPWKEAGEAEQTSDYHIRIQGLWRIAQRAQGVCVHKHQLGRAHLDHAESPVYRAELVADEQAREVGG